MNSPLHIDEISETLITCPYCHWQGFGDEAEPSDIHGDVREIYCPSCMDVVGLVTYPAISVSAESQCELIQSLPFNHVNAGERTGHRLN